MSLEKYTKITQNIYPKNTENLKVLIKTTNFKEKSVQNTRYFVHKFYVEFYVKVSAKDFKLGTLFKEVNFLVQGSKSI